ncbi:hypothetical protein ACTXT7_012787 [Hymenolepis weldensis]
MRRLRIGQRINLPHQRLQIRLPSVHIYLRYSPIRDVTQFSSTPLENFYRNLSISLLHSQPKLGDLYKQLVNNVKRRLCVSQGEKTVKEIPNSLQLKYQTKTQAVFQIGVRYCTQHLSRHAAVTFKPKTDPTQIYLCACDHPPPWKTELWRPSTIIVPIITLHAPEDLEKIQSVPNAQKYA